MTWLNGLWKHQFSFIPIKHDIVWSEKAVPGSSSKTICGCSCKLLNLHQALCLKLKEGLVGWQADVITALRGGTAQPCALPACQEQYCYFALQAKAHTGLASTYFEAVMSHLFRRQTCLVPSNTAALPCSQWHVWGQKGTHFVASRCPLTRPHLLRVLL